MTLNTFEEEEEEEEEEDYNKTAKTRLYRKSGQGKKNTHEHKRHHLAMLNEAVRPSVGSALAAGGRTAVDGTGSFTQ